MKVLMLVKDIRNKTLVSGDKSLRIVLEVANPVDSYDLNMLLADKIELDVDFLD